MAFTKVVGPGIHTLSNILSHNINSSGIITATKFVGPFDNAIIGGGTTISSDGINVTGIVTATGLDINGNGDISGNLVVGGNLTANGDFTTLNTTLREVELLRVDANSSAIAGIITQRGSGDILSVYDTSTEVFKIADGGNAKFTSKLGVGVDPVEYLDIRTTGSATALVGSTNAGGAYFKLDGDSNGDGSGGDYARLLHDTDGRFYIDNLKSTADIVFRNGASATERLRITSGGNLRLGLDSVAEQTDSAHYIMTLTGKSGQTGAGAIAFKDPSANTDGFIFADGGNLFITSDYSNATADSSIRFRIDGSSEKVRITSDGFVGIGVTNPEDYDSGAKNLVVGSSGQEGITIRSSSPNTGNLQFSDGATKIAGISFKHDSTASNRYFSFLIDNGSSYVEQLRLQDGKLIFSNDQNSYISGGSDVFRFTTGGTERVRINASGNVKLPDAAELQFGGALHTGDGDLKIFHDSSATNNVISGHTGSLNLRNYDTNSTDIILSARNDILLQTAINESAIWCDANAGVHLYYDGAQKLVTASTGIDVTGEVAASQDYPLVKPILNWNFAATKTLDPRIQFRRNGTGTFIDEKGIVQYAGNNKPRFDHHPTSGASLGLLLEKSSTNYQEYSTLMSESNIKNNITVTDNFAISPDGTQNASKIVNSTSNNAQTNIAWNGSSVANGSYANWSIFVKSEETSCILQFYSNTYIFGSDRVNIELADGTYGGDTIDSTFRWIIEKYPNKWWRISVSGNGVGAAGAWYIGVVDSKTAARGATCGSATNKTWFAWGVQEEISTDRKFATSYIPTYGVSMNRGHDDAEVLGDDFDDFFDRYQGTVIHEFSNAFQYWAGGGSGWEFNNDNYQYNCITQISSGYSHNGYPGAYAVAHGESSDSGSNSMSLFGSDSSPGNRAHQNGYYAGRFPNNSTPDSARFYKTYTDGMSWDVSGPTNYIRTGSGGFSTTGSNTNVISYRNISKLAFGNGANDMDGSYQRFNGRIKNWMYYDKALSASQLATMTAQHPVTYL